MANKKPEKPEVLKAEIVDDVPTSAQLSRYQGAEEELSLTPVFNLEKAKQRMAELQEFVKFYLVEGEDYGVIPGTKKPTLLKPGADKLCDIYGLSDDYITISQTIDWSQGLFDYEIKCILKSKRTEKVVGTGVGSCSSFESKYRYREMKRTCPSCHKETIIRGREEFGGGYICWKKEGKSDGCGAKFPVNSPKYAEINSQVVGRAAVDDPADQKNTVLKMAKKRAKIDAVISATRSSGLFTQDMEDRPEPVAAPNPAPNVNSGVAPAPPAPAPKAPAAPPAAKPPASKPATKPTGPPKAVIPPAETIPPPKPKEPIKPPPPAAAAPAVPQGTTALTLNDRVKVLALQSGCSTTNISSFMFRVLGITKDEITDEVKPRFKSVVIALERTLEKFIYEPLSVGKLIVGEEINPAVTQTFKLHFAQLDGAK